MMYLSLRIGSYDLYIIQQRLIAQNTNNMRICEVVLEMTLTSLSQPFEFAWYWMFCALNFFCSWQFSLVITLALTSGDQCQMNMSITTKLFSPPLLPYIELKLLSMFICFLTNFILLVEALHRGGVFLFPIYYINLFQQIIRVKCEFSRVDTKLKIELGFIQSIDSCIIEGVSCFQSGEFQGFNFQESLYLDLVQRYSKRAETELVLYILSVQSFT